MNLKYFIKKDILKKDKLDFLLLLKLLYVNLNFRFVFYLRLTEWLRYHKMSFLVLFFNKKMIKNYGCFIGSKVEIGHGVKFPHANGIIIGEKTKIGENCTIYQQVTFGGKIIGDAENSNYPLVGNNVVIFAGAKIIGNVSVGNNVVIGANSVVNKNVPSNTIVAGVPAKVLKNI